MTSCFEPDTLVTVGTALEWQTDEALRHLADCDRCRERLQELSVIHHAFTVSLQPAPTFTDAVMRSLRQGAQSHVEANRRFGLLTLVNTVLAAATAFFAVALLSAERVAEPRGVVLVLAAAIVAAGTLWWNWVHAEPGAGHSPSPSGQPE